METKPAAEAEQTQPVQSESQQGAATEQQQTAAVETKPAPETAQAEPVQVEAQQTAAASQPKPEQAEVTAQTIQNEEQSVPEPEAPPIALLTAGETEPRGMEKRPIEAAQAAGPQTKATTRAPARSIRPKGTVQGRAEAHPGGVTSKRPIALNASLTVLAGVGPRHAAMLTRLGINTLGDMLYNYPRRYEDYSKLKPIRDVFYGEVLTVIGEVTDDQLTAGARAENDDRGSRDQ